ncbi:MAG TPA: glucosyltransferase domain-containing protein [Sedimentibacter sp.]|nr:glucosyltransferase domain-containing protein [Sedimentibacter sp.]
MSMPEECMMNLKSRIKKEWIIAFLSVVIIGFATYLYKFTNYLPNWDSIAINYTDYSTANDWIRGGRWFFIIGYGITGYVNIPILSGLLSILYIAITAVLVVELLNIKKVTTIILISAIMITFPTVSSGFAFMPDTFFLSLVLAVTAVFLTTKLKNIWGILFGIVLLSFSMGTYQAYLSVAIVLILILLIQELSKKTISIRVILKKGVNYLVMGIGGIALYFGITQALLLLTNQTLTSHQGMSDVGNSVSTGMIGNIRKVIIDFSYFFMGSIHKVTIFQVMNILLFICGIVLFVIWIIRNGIYQEILRLGAIIVLMIGIPLACYIYYLVTPSITYHPLMLYSMSFVYIFIFFLYDKVELKTSFIHWITVMISITMVYLFILNANKGYMALTQSYEKTYGIVNRMADRIEQLEGYSNIDKIAVVGYINNESYENLSFDIPMTGFTDGLLITHQTHIVMFLNSCLGINLIPAKDDEINQIIESVEYEQMNCWPASMSILQIGDTVVIKLEDK